MTMIDAEWRTPHKTQVLHRRYMADELSSMQAALDFAAAVCDLGTLGYVESRGASDVPGQDYYMFFPNKDEFLNHLEQISQFEKNNEIRIHFFSDGLTPLECLDVYVVLPNGQKTEINFCGNDELVYDAVEKIEDMLAEQSGNSSEVS